MHDECKEGRSGQYGGVHLHERPRPLRSMLRIAHSDGRLYHVRRSVRKGLRGAGQGTGGSGTRGLPVLSHWAGAVSGVEAHGGADSHRQSHGGTCGLCRCQGVS